MEWCLFLACNGGDSFCVGQCKLGEGDCDSDSDCEGNLVKVLSIACTET